MYSLLAFVTAIAFKKKSFRKYFDHEDNYLYFHQCVSRVFDAPTLEIQALLQTRLVIELHRRDEHRAAAWYEDTWTGEHGNYTNASAGYCATRTSAGLESRWRYMRRDTIGTAGTTRRVSLKVYGPCMVKYVKDTSTAHAAKILDRETGMHIFPSIPKISTSLWRAAQEFDVTRLILCSIEGNAASRTQWEHEMQFFYPQDLEQSAEAKLSPPSITQLLKLYHDGGRSIQVTRRDVIGVVMPTEGILAHLRKKYKLQEFTQPNIDALALRLEPLRNMYHDLFHDTGGWDAKYPNSDLKLILKVMESFDR